jgi:hypothetical protein
MLDRRGFGIIAGTAAAACVVLLSSVGIVPFADVRVLPSTAAALQRFARASEPRRRHLSPVVGLAFGNRGFAAVLAPDALSIPPGGLAGFNVNMHAVEGFGGHAQLVILSPNSFIRARPESTLINATQSIRIVVHVTVGAPAAFYSLRVFMLGNGGWSGGVVRIRVRSP